MIEVMSTRLFPKNHGATGYSINGIAARCDWVVLSDLQRPSVMLAKRVGSASPRTVFVSLRNPFEALAFFLDKVLPLITTPFILVTGSEDVTIPHQLDKRWRPFTTKEIIRIEALLEDSRLIRWFAENLDDCGHPKFFPLPLGLVFPESTHDHRIPVPSVPQLGERPLRVLCAHRVRGGVQWDLRRTVTQLCRQYFSRFCTILDDEVSEAAFIKLIQQHAFVICVEGGGLDPSPKAWLAILHGAIPILRSTPLDKAYARLPVVFVEQWDASALSMNRLEQWLHQHAPSHDVSANRDAVLQRLGIDYWWSVICSGAEPLC